jgi:TatD DNase family protein
VLDRARAAGVTGNVVVGIDAEGSRRATALAALHGDVYAAVGFHPHEAKSLDAEALRLLRELAREPGVVALGEIGLDFYRNLSPKDAQERAFREQLDLAADLGLPVIIHSRQAETETLEIVERWAQENPALKQPRGVLHCFAGNAATAERYVEMGFFISVAGNVTYPNAGRLRSVIAGVPLDRLLIETDCPFLAPQSRRGRRSEPADVAETAKEVAAVKRTSYGDVARATTENARLLFRIQVNEPARKT